MLQPQSPKVLKGLDLSILRLFSQDLQKIESFESFRAFRRFRRKKTTKRLRPLEVLELPESQNAERPQSLDFEAILPRPPKD